MRLTKAEADLLLPMGEREFDGSVLDLAAATQNAYWVIDDAPYPYWERERLLDVLVQLGDKHGFEVGVI